MEDVPLCTHPEDVPLCSARQHADGSRSANRRCARTKEVILDAWTKKHLRGVRTKLHLSDVRTNDYLPYVRIDEWKLIFTISIIERIAI